MTFPYILATNYNLEHSEDEFSPVPKDDSLLANRIHRSTVVLDESPLSEQVDKNVNGTIKRNNAATNFNL